jgi:murein DD-endopeptidase MepM/ murein hydrolase activator NlpD
VSESPQLPDPCAGEKRGPKRLPLLVLALVLVLAAGLALVLLLGRRRPACGPALPHPDSTFYGGEALGTKDVLASVLGRWCFSTVRTDSVYMALAKTDFNFRNMRAGDSVTFRYLGLKLAGLSYHKNIVTSYDVDIDSLGRMSAHRHDKPVDTARSVIRGAIKNSLWNTLIEAGERPALVVDYAEILSYEVDFLTEVQEGDSYEILLDKYYVDSTFYREGKVWAVRFKGAAGTFAGFWYQLPSGHWDYYNEKGQSLRKTVLRSPLTFANVTSGFGNRMHPVVHRVRHHNGVDYGAPTGTPVAAIADGTVVRASWFDGYGNFVEIRHAGGLNSRYGHLSRYGAGIKSGRSVRQGQTVGYVGTTGMSTGPHLHFEVRKNGTPVNPLKVIPPRAEPVPSKYLDDFKRVRDGYLSEIADFGKPDTASN